MHEKILWLFAALALLLAAALFTVTQPILFAARQPAPPAVSPAELEKHVRMLSETFHPRSFDCPENLEAAASYIEAHFTATGARVTSHTYQAEEHTYRNIIASFGPDNGPVLIVGAHYDSYGDAARPDPLHTPGADDNASGVAGLLALANLLQKYPPHTQVQLVAYALEEPPFFATRHMGSAVHAAQLAKDHVDVSGMLALEMIGYFSDAEASQTFPVEGMGYIYPTAGNFISVVGRLDDISLTRRVKSAMTTTTPLPVRSINALPLVPGLDFSDHRNFWHHGFPAVMITNTAFYRNFSYHTVDDTADSLDYQRMSQAVQGVYAAVKALSSK